MTASRPEPTLAEPAAAPLLLPARLPLGGYAIDFALGNRTSRALAPRSGARYHERHEGETAA